MSTLASEPASKRAKLDVATQLFDRGSNIREVAFSVAFPTRELKLIEVTQ